MRKRTTIFQYRISRKLLRETRRIARDMGTTPGAIVRLLFQQMVIRRSMPFPLRTDCSGNGAMRPAWQRAKRWDEMNGARRSGGVNSKVRGLKSDLIRHRNGASSSP